MFKIYGGETKLKQWTKGNKLTVPKLPIGAEVFFYNDPYEDEPLVSEVYSIQDDSGNDIHVCDVPNNLLMQANKIKVYVPSKVKGLYGVIYSVVGQREKYIEIEPAEKPADYVPDPDDSDGDHSCDISDEQIEAAVEKYMSENPSGSIEYVPNEEVIALLGDA